MTDPVRRSRTLFGWGSWPETRRITQILGKETTRAGRAPDHVRLPAGSARVGHHVRMARVPTAGE
jgi:hypothetical protein